MLVPPWILIPHSLFLLKIYESPPAVTTADPQQRFQPSEPLCTELYTVAASVDFATRVAKIVARRTGKPTYIGCSVAFENATVEDEIASTKAAVDGIMIMLDDEENGT